MYSLDIVEVSEIKLYNNPAKLVPINSSLINGCELNFTLEELAINITLSAISHTASTTTL